MTKPDKSTPPLPKGLAKVKQNALGKYYEQICSLPKRCQNNVLGETWLWKKKKKKKKTKQNKKTKKNDRKSESVQPKLGIHGLHRHQLSSCRRGFKSRQTPWHTSPWRICAEALPRSRQSCTCHPRRASWAWTVPPPAHHTNRSNDENKTTIREHIYPNVATKRKHIYEQKISLTSKSKQQTHKEKNKSKSRLPNQNGIFQACHIVQIHHSGPEASKCSHDWYSPYLKGIFSVILHQPSRTFDLHHTTLQRSGCTSFSFPVTLWPSVNIQSSKLESNYRV